MQPVSAMRKLWWFLCKTEICVSFESILAQISATYLDCEFDNSAYCAHVLPCKNGTIISIYLIKPLWADFSAEHSQEKLNDILQMMLAYLLFCTPFVAQTTLLKSLGDSLELISNYTQNPHQSSWEGGKYITHCPTSDGHQTVTILRATVTILRAVRIVCAELLFLS